MAETIKTEQTLLTGSIPAIAGIEDPSQARMILYQAGRPVHAPMDNVGLATSTEMNAALDGLVTAETKSRLVNGAMQVSQENGNTSSSTASSLSFYAADQWTVQSNVSPGTITASRVASVTPNGSRNRIRFVVGTAAPTLSSGFASLNFRQNIEGIRVADFGWGTAAARQVVLRFGFKGPAGTYCAGIMHPTTRCYIALFTISAGQANTDTEQVFVIPGDVAGTWATDTNISFQVLITMAAGSSFLGTTGWQSGSFYSTAACSNGMATAGNTFELWDAGLYLDPNATGVAPPWVMPDEAEELRACQRYWHRVGLWFNGNTTSGQTYWSYGAPPVEPRTVPAMSGTNVSNNGFPATVGTIDRAVYTSYREARVANATGGACWFYTDIIANARM